MISFCLGCGASLAAMRGDDAFHCRECLEVLRPLQRARRWHLLGGDERPCGVVSTLWEYREPFRSLVLRAKVGGVERSLACLQNLIGRDEHALALAREADLLLPVPSSFWGRVRGRYDLAHLLTATLSQIANRRLIVAPVLQHWRVRKRARMEGRKAAGSFLEHAPMEGSVWTSRGVLGGGKLSKIRRLKDAQGARILVVDDIVTTGFTMAHVAAGFGDVDWSFLALGDASGVTRLGFFDERERKNDGDDQGGRSGDDDAHDEAVLRTQGTRGRRDSLFSYGGFF